MKDVSEMKMEVEDCLGNPERLSQKMKPSPIIMNKDGDLVDSRNGLLYGSVDWLDWIENKPWCGTDGRLDMAIRTAIKAHDGQFRKGTQTPYVYHPFAVGLMLIQAECDDDVVIAGFLHDVVEDTSITLQDVAIQFGYRVAGIVQGCSEPNKALPWIERKQHTIDYLRSAPIEVRLVTAADKLHNIAAMIEDYAICGEALWNRFNRGRDEQEWYYRLAVEALGANEFREHQLYKKLAHKVDELFKPRSSSLADEIYDDIVQEEERYGSMELDHERENG